MKPFALPGLLLWIGGDNGFAAPDSDKSREYILHQSIGGKDFFDNFDFFTENDPTHGFVDFVGRDGEWSTMSLAHDHIAFSQRRTNSV
jgi:hypothetical protein